MLSCRGSARTRSIGVARAHQCDFTLILPRVPALLGRSQAVFRNIDGIAKLAQHPRIHCPRTLCPSCPFSSFFSQVVPIATLSTGRSRPKMFARSQIRASPHPPLFGEAAWDINLRRGCSRGGALLRFVQLDDAVDRPAGPFISSSPPCI